MHLHLTAYEIIWLIVSPGIILSWYYLIRGWRTYIHRHGDMPHNPYPHITFMITARKITPLISNGVKSIMDSCEECEYTNYDIKVVADKDGILENAEHVIVPKDYVCKSKFKARALNYALGHIPDSKDVWILHLDEDAKVTTQCVQSIMKYIKDGGKPVANGPSVFPYDGNILTFFVEAQRYWTFFWVKRQMETSRVHWMNGSNMLVRSDVEHKIGWDFEGLRFSEDTRFAYEMNKKLGNVFGWHGGLTIEKPPKNVMAAIRQRKRWFWGGLLQFRHAPKGRWFRRLYSSLSWFLGFILVMFFPFLFLHQYLPAWLGAHLIMIGWISVTGIFWLIRYQVGMSLNLKYSNCSQLAKLGLRIALVFLAPLIDFIGTVSTVLALVNHPKVFEVTDKSMNDIFSEIEDKHLTGVSR